MNCNKYEKQISLYVDKELSAEEEKQLMQHLDECKECQKQLQAIEFMRNMMKQEEIPAKPLNKLKKRIYFKIYRDLLILFAGLVMVVSMVAVTGGLAQMFLFDRIAYSIRIIFFSGILLLIVGLIILMYDVLVDMFKIGFKK